MYHTSLIDSDTYKFSMGDFILKKQPRVQAEYSFFNRDNRDFPEDFATNLRDVVNSFRSISLKKDEKDFLREKCYYLDPSYLDFLEGYRYDPSEVIIKQEGTKPNIKVRGPMYRTIYWEVPLMATISELYFKMTNQPHLSESEIRQRAQDKADKLREMCVLFSELGTRRRYSYNVHCWVLEELKKNGGAALVGTSNPHLAMKYNLTPMGTMAHELFSLYGALYGYQMANQMVMEHWVDVFQGELGTVLPDTFTTRVFLRCFNAKYAKLFDGIRQDSGDALEFIDWVLPHYRKLRIDPMTKVILFSNALDSIAKIREIHACCENKTKDRYGIGTWFTNDCGPKALNMVIKLTACMFDDSWIPTVKISDDISKNTGNSEAVELCKRILDVRYI